jgi:hydrogenase expression/formation protein HypE
MIPFATGKLPPDTLAELLQKIDCQDTRVTIGPRVGEDAAVLDMGDRYLVATTDPITFTETRLGWYGVNINANDVAVKGAEPRWFMATLLLPEGKSDEALVKGIFDDILESCRCLGVTLIGGHTEITSRIDRPILIGHMLGEVSKDDLVTMERVTPGDAVLLTQGIAIEGTAILALEKGEELSSRIDTGLIDRAKKFHDDPGISVVKAAITASRAAHVRGMHDPTEGGIATALWELGQAAQCGLRIDGNLIPVFPETRAFCDILGIDPWGLISSGALLIVVDAQDVDVVRRALNSVDIPCQSIGKIVPMEEGLTIRRGKVYEPLRPFERDELAKIL